MEHDNDFDELADALRPVIRDEVIQALRTTGASREWLTTDEVCELLRVSRSTIHRWRKERMLIAHRLGGKVYFRAEDISGMMRIITNEESGDEDEEEEET